MYSLYSSESDTVSTLGSIAVILLHKWRSSILLLPTKTSGVETSNHRPRPRSDFALRRMRILRCVQVISNMAFFLYYHAYLAVNLIPLTSLFLSQRHKRISWDLQRTNVASLSTWVNGRMAQRRLHTHFGTRAGSESEQGRFVSE